MEAVRDSLVPNAGALPYKESALPFYMWLVKCIRRGGELKYCLQVIKILMLIISGSVPGS